MVMTAGSPVSYQVTSVAPKDEWTPNNQRVPGKQVTFKTSTGYMGSVFVPDSVFGNLNTVKALIEGEVRVIAQAMTLTGTVS